MNRRIIGALGAVGAIGGILLPSGAWASFGENFGSVHFNSGEPDFGTPPRRGVREGQDTRPSAYGESQRGGPLYVELTEERDEAERERRQRERRASRVQIAAAIAKRDWSSALHRCEREAATLGWTGSLRDYAEVLTIASEPFPRTSPGPERLQAYFHALALSDGDYQNRREAQTIFERLYRDSLAGFLREHALYQRASLEYCGKDFNEALKSYERFLQEFPRSVKREAALIMVARCGLLPAAVTQSDPPAARRALQQLHSEFPNSRFRRAALGLQARDAYRNGDYDKAAEIYRAIEDVSSLTDAYNAMPRAAQERWQPRLLAAHLSLMERTRKQREYLWSLQQIDRMLQALTPDGARTFVAMLHKEPGLAAPYFYYRLYYTLDTPRKPHDDEWQDADSRRSEWNDYETERIKRHRELTDLSRLAERIAARHKDALPLSVQIKLAEIHYQRGDYGDAVRWANRALQASEVGEETYARALFVRGATRHRQRQETAAISDFETLLKRCADSPMRSGAREELAILYEDTGDLAAALDQYFALDYRQDIAYILDVRMPTATVAAYVVANPRHGQRDLLHYSLGVRSLRDGDLSAARRNLQSVPRARYRNFSKITDYLGENEHGPDPLTTINEIMELKSRIARTRTREARAMAEYDYASYHYKSGTLLFYNAALWKGQRIWLFEEMWNYRQQIQGDVRAVERHMMAHEAYAHALRLCLQIVHDYPRTKAEPLALYRAACAASRLAALNHCWGYPPNLEAKASHLMALLARRYPHHPLASHARKYADVFAREGQARHDEFRHRPLLAQNRRSISYNFASLYNGPE